MCIRDRAVSLFLIGGYLLFHGSHYYSGPPKAKNWPLAEASIKNIEIGKGICLGYREIDFASIRFDFTYEVNGKTYSDYLDVYKRQNFNGPAQTC